MHKLGFSEGNADKFWQIERIDCNVELKWGRTGTAGQSQAKQFASESEAEQFLNQQLKAKLKKGYLPLEAEGAPPLTDAPPPVPKPAKAKPAPKEPKAIIPSETASEALFSAPSVDVGFISPHIQWTPKLREKELVEQYYEFNYPGQIVAVEPAYDATAAWKKLGPELEKGFQNAHWKGDPAWQELGKTMRKLAISVQPETVSAEIAAIVMAVSRRRQAVDFVWETLGPAACLQAWITAHSISSEVVFSSEAKRHVYEIKQVKELLPLSTWELGNAKVWGLRSRIAQMEASAVQALAKSLENLRSQAPLSLRLSLDWLFPDQAAWLQTDLQEWQALNPSKDYDLWESGWYLWPWLCQPELLDLIAAQFISLAKDHADLWDRLSLIHEPALFWLLERAGHGATQSLYAWIVAGKRASTRKKAVAALKLIQSEAALNGWFELLKHKDAGKEAHAQLSANPAWGVKVLIQGLRKRKRYPEAETLLTGLLRSLPAETQAELKGLFGAEFERWQPETPAAPLASELPSYFQPQNWPAVSSLSKTLPKLKDLELPSSPASMDFSRPVIESEYALQPYIYDKPPLTAKRDPEMLARFAGFDHVMLHHLDWLSDAAALQFWNEAPPTRWNPYDPKAEDLNTLAMRFGLAGLPGFLTLFEKYPEATYSSLCHFDTPQVVPILLKGLTMSSMRTIGKNWFLQHPSTALRGLIPLSLNPKWGLQIEALRLIQFLLTRRDKPSAALSPDQVKTLASEFGPEAQAAFDALLAIDPLLLQPAKQPKLPPFWKPEQLPPVMLKTGERLPTETLDILALTLMLDSPGLPFQGVEIVKALCTPESLEAFALGLFELWLGDGGALKQEWAFWGLAHWGAQEAVRQLVPRLEKWPGERSVQRALLGLELLFAMEKVENAWPELHRLSIKTRFPSVQDKAGLLMRKLAQENPDGAEGLGDRLVPKLGLDPHGGRDFDLGQGLALRLQITAGGQLELHDSQGKKRAKAPSKGEPTALKSLKQAQKDLEKQIAFQKMRLERAMYTGRRWSLAAFENSLQAHPLLQKLLYGLVWGLYTATDERPQQVICLNPEGSFVDLQGKAVTIPAGQMLGLVHPLEIMPSLQPWRAHWAKEGRIQPFEQLEREVFIATLAELAKTKLKDPGKVASGKVLALMNQADWKAPKDGEGELRKELGRGWEAEISLEFHVWALKEYPEVDVFHVHLRRSESYGGVRLEQVHPIAYSELRRDLARLA